MKKEKIGGLAQPVFITGSSVDLPIRGSIDVNSDDAKIFSISNGNVLVAVKKVLIPILSIRANNDNMVSPKVIQIFAEDKACHFKALHNPGLIGTNWINLNNIQYDISASSLNGGVELISGYIGIGNDIGSFGFPSNFILESGGILTVAAIRIGNKDVNVGSAITWTEKV